ncbi:enoyl-CoA hydratase-related protein [Candidatus Binatia bacterium]|nr:enoyl-CoA hydratase-related protein [Candidatus Binatia bacterium]
MYATLDVREDGPVSWLTLNRPDSLNALTTQMVADLRDYFDRLTTDTTIRIVVIRGAGRAFCAGLDLKEAAAGAVSGSVADLLRRQRSISELAIRMRHVPQPIIACVHGPACGGGFALALAADVRIAGESMRMNAAFIRIGLSGCEIGVSYFLPRIVGVSVASELLLTGRFIHAPRALATGLVSEIVPDTEMEAAARRLCEDMLTTSPLGLRLTKECLNASLDAGSLEHVIAMEDRNQVLCTQTGDVHEGVLAFLEKRPPAYRDR